MVVQEGRENDLESFSSSPEDCLGKGVPLVRVSGGQACQRIRATWSAHWRRGPEAAAGEVQHGPLESLEVPKR